MICSVTNLVSSESDAMNSSDICDRCGLREMDHEYADKDECEYILYKANNAPKGRSFFTSRLAMLFESMESTRRLWVVHRQFWRKCGERSVRDEYYQYPIWLLGIVKFISGAKYSESIGYSSLIKDEFWHNNDFHDLVNLFKTNEKIKNTYINLVKLGSNLEESNQYILGVLNNNGRGEYVDKLAIAAEKYNVPSYLEDKWKRLLEGIPTTKSLSNMDDFYIKPLELTGYDKSIVDYIEYFKSRMYASMQIPAKYFTPMFGRVDINTIARDLVSV